MKFFFVERNAAGEIIGLFSRPQTGIPVERLPDDDPEVLAFLAQGDIPGVNDLIDGLVTTDSFTIGLLGMLAERLPGNVPVDDIIADIKRLATPSPG